MTADFHDPTGQQFLSERLDKGRPYFSIHNARAVFGSGPQGAHAFARSLLADGRILMPARGFYVILSPDTCSPPPVQNFIAALMKRKRCFDPTFCLP